MFVAPRHYLRRSGFLPLNTSLMDMSRRSNMFDYFMNYPEYYVTMRNPLQQTIEKPQQKEFKVDISGFHPDDVVIKSSGNNVIIEANREDNAEDGYESRSFRRVLSFPDSTDMNSIKCELTPRGVLAVTAPKPQQHRRIPIETSRQKRSTQRNVTIKQADGTYPEETQKSEAITEADETKDKGTMNVMDCDRFDGMLKRYNHSYEKFLDDFFHLDITSVPDKMLDTNISTFEEKDDKFEVEVDTRAFTPEEVNIKVTDDSVITITARHEENHEGKHSYNHMIQRYHLPKNAVVEDVQSSLTADGKLTITAPKKMLKAKEQETEMPNTKEKKTESK